MTPGPLRSSPGLIRVARPGRYGENMDYRTLGRTGVKVSPLCLGAMMFGAWGNPDHDDCVRDHPPRRSTPASTSSTPPTSTRAGSRRRSSARRWPAAGATTSCSPPRSTARWARTRTSPATRAAGSCARSRTACGGCGTDWIDLYQIHRPEPDTDIDETLGALTDLVRAGKVRYIGSSTFPASQIVEAQWAAERRGRERFVCEQPPYSMLVRGIEADVLPTCQRYGMGVIPWSPLAGGWLSRALPQGRRAARRSARPAHPGTLRPLDAREPAQARGRRRAGGARRGGRHDADRAGARVRHPPPGGHRGDHRPAHDGAPRVPARPRPT